MSWMSEIAIMVDHAREFGVTLTVSDFRVSDGFLLLDGMPADEWFDAMFESHPDTLAEMEL